MKIFFSILLCISFLNSFSQSDSVKNKFTVGISPLLFFTPTDEVLYFEYQPKKKISFELGGGVYNSIIHNFDQTITSGFAIRSAIIFYRGREIILQGKDFIKYSGDKGSRYFKLLFFYRQLKYTDRYYDECSDKVFESKSPFFCPGELHKSKIGNEIKNVFCLEALWGRKYFLDEKEHFFFDYYYGFGFREKYRALSITQAHTLSPWYLSPVNPPREEIIISYLPSIHCGIKFGYLF